MSSGEDNSDNAGYHPSGRRRSVELVEAMRAQMMLDADASESASFHPSGRRRSIEMADAMRRQMQNGDDDGASYHPSGRRRSVELADEARQQMLSEGMMEDEDSREIQELIFRGIISANNTDGELFGDGATASKPLNELSGMRKTSKQSKIDFKVPFEFDDKGIPVNWDGEHIPSQDSDILFGLVELNPTDEEYKTIDEDFKIAELDVVKIERLQNLHLLDKYKGEKEQVLKRRGRDFDVNARYLYHGSTADKERLCEEGLDARLSMSGCFGKGIYFSDDPRKCLQYVKAMSEGYLPYILMCRVMLGEAKIYPNNQMDRTLKREPEKENPTGGWRYYDSVRGRPVDFNEYVVYENRRAMIEYIITFKHKGQEYIAPSASGQVGRAVEANLIKEESLEEHMQRIEQVREEIRQKRAAERGQVYSGPTAAQRKKDRDVWRRVLKVTCPEGSPGSETVEGIHKYLDKQEKDDRSGRWQPPGASLTVGDSASGSNDGNNNSNPNCPGTVPLPLATDDDDDTASIQLVLNSLVSDFMNVTQTDNVQRAKMYIEKAGMNLDQAILFYYEEN